MSSIMACDDLVCFALLGTDSSKQASRVLLPHYMLHALFLLSFLIMIIMIDRYRHFLVCVVVSACACIYQAYLVISQYFGARVFSFQKRIYFRKGFWVATDSKNTGLFNSFRSYRIMEYIILVMILVAIAFCIWYSHEIFRGRYLVLMLMTIAYSLTETLGIRFSIPVWMLSYIYNIMVILSMYYVVYYADNKLRTWSLDSFANDMTDGLILYDKNDDLIHINNMIKNTLDKDLMESFRDRKALEDWMHDEEHTDSEGIITYNSGEEEYYFRVKVSKLGDRENEIGTLFIIHDTTNSVIRIKAMEEANRELQRVSRMKSDFLANMSHEIRTPMNAVIGMTEIAMREKDTGDITDYLIQIRNSGQNLLNIINDILDYSKIESGKMDIIEDDYEPLSELSDIAKILATRIGDKDIEFSVINKSELPKTLKGDAMRIRQIIINIANNAIKFTQKGFVTIEVKCETISTDTVYLTYHVKDSGIGIKQEDIDKLFVSFQQLDSKRNRAVEGTGLGLAISQKLVTAMHGSIGVESVYGKGSDFWFIIPQKIVDPTNVIKVEDAEGKFAYGLNDKDTIVNMFDDELERLRVDHKSIRSLSEYENTGKKEYLFFEDKHYDRAMMDFLDANPKVNGIMLVPFGSEFSADISNLTIMQRPQTTMLMLKMLNGDPMTERDVQEKAFRIDFTAPSANILVVDDNMINIKIAEGLLKPIKANMDSAMGGQSAIDKVKNNEYDIVFMDHMMPGMDGVEATRVIRADKTIKQPAIVALSANALPEARSLFANAGMEDFVAKPIDVKNIVAAVKKWLPDDKIIENSPEDMAEDLTDKEEAKVIQCYGIDDAKSAVAGLGSVDLYNKILEEYLKSGAEKKQAIIDDYNKEDWEDYTIRVHALKSSSRQIGAKKLGAMAEALEKAGKAGDIDAIRSGNDAAVSEYGKLLDALFECIGTEETDGDLADKPMIDKATLDQLLDELYSACDDLDMDGMESAQSKLQDYSYDDDIREYITSMIKAIDGLDAEECLDIIEKLRSI